MGTKDRVIAPLTTPVKRVGFVILLAGIAATLIGLTQMGSDIYHYMWFEKFMHGLGKAIGFERNSFRRYPLASIGPYMALCGLLLSYLYDHSVGRLLIWIQRG